jgi:hypothetical protein
MPDDRLERTAEIASDVVQVGVEVLEAGLRSGKDRAYIVRAVHLAMTEASETSPLSDGVREFAAETVHNLRSIAEEVARVERRAADHWAKLSG